MSEVTQLLVAARDGDPDSLGLVFEAVYPELKRLAASRVARQAPGSTLTTTTLVHETYLKLLRSEALEIRDRRHFFACAAKAMRHLLVDHVRAALAEKRGGTLDAITLPTEPSDLGEDAGSGPGHRRRFLDLDRALEELEALDPELRELVELRYFAGLTREEVAELHECTVRTVHRRWRRARAFLHARLETRDSTPN